MPLDEAHLLRVNVPPSQFRSLSSDFFPIAATFFLLHLSFEQLSCGANRVNSPAFSLSPADHLGLSLESDSKNGFLSVHLLNPLGHFPNGRRLCADDFHHNGLL